MTAKRQTWQKDAVKHALGQSTGFVSAQDLHQILKQHGSPIGLATVYRALADLAQQEQADSLQSASGETLFRACGQTHHHHLICTDCGATVEIGAAEIEVWANAVAKSHGFTPASHTIELFGICGNCKH